MVGSCLFYVGLRPYWWIHPCDGNPVFLCKFHPNVCYEFDIETLQHVFFLASSNLIPYDAKKQSHNAWVNFTPLSAETYYCKLRFKVNNKGLNHAMMVFLLVKHAVQKHDTLWHYTDVSKNRGTLKWMVKIMETPIKMDGLGGPPLFLETSIQWQYNDVNIFQEGTRSHHETHVVITTPCWRGPPAVIRCAMPIASCHTPQNRRGWFKLDQKKTLANG